ncbi:MAG TPA: hypothetical protein VMY78_05115 [Solirubrobacteraceae bacterium]|nr:hypothetical protein [Solirubrobacteraceae bacterium]
MRPVSNRQPSVVPGLAKRRRLHIVPSPAPRPEPMHPDERRLRDAGGPHDRACYSCGCGFLFEAPVSASVQCPNCETEQAW